MRSFWFYIILFVVGIGFLALLTGHLGVTIMMCLVACFLIAAL